MFVIGTRRDTSTTLLVRIPMERYAAGGERWEWRERKHGRDLRTRRCSLAACAMKLVRGCARDGGAARRAVRGNERRVSCGFGVRKQTFEAPGHAATDFLTLPVAVSPENLTRAPPPSPRRLESPTVRKQYIIRWVIIAVLGAERNFTSVLGFVRQSTIPFWGILQAVAGGGRKGVTASAFMWKYWCIISTRKI